MKDERERLVDLTRELIALDTVNPPGNEIVCARHLAAILEAGGFEIELIEFEPGRPNLLARCGSDPDRRICLSGHLDTVPLGAAEWSVDPFGGEVDGDRIFGRGASDMKGGLAAIVGAALQLKASGGDRANLLLALTAGEEAGCQGAAFLGTQKESLGGAGALVIGEPTGNMPLVGHRGALWLEIETTGVTAHGATPELGVNAIYSAAEAIQQLARFSFGTDPHPVMGLPTLNVGTVKGGLNINSVPDRAVLEVDIRTIPGQSHAQVIDSIRKTLSKDVSIRTIKNVEGVATDPEHPWVVSVFELAAGALGQAVRPAAAPYFTDAAFLTPALGNPPTLILGPGEAAMAHKTDESCSINAIVTAAEIYFEIGCRWCGI